MSTWFARGSTLGRSIAVALATAAYCAAAAGCASRAGAPPAPAITITDTDEELRAWEAATAGSGSLERAIELRRTVLRRHPSIYGPVLRVPDDSSLARYVEWLSPRLGATHIIIGHGVAELPKGVRFMARVFPELDTAVVEAFVGLSLGSTNGTVRLRDGQPVLVIGADVQTIVSTDAADMRAVVLHELAHVAHAMVNPDVYGMLDAGVRGRPTPLYLSLFSEGLAVWAAERADSTLTKELLYLSPTLEAEARAACARQLPALAAELESTDPARYADWFFLSGKDPAIPRRFAYVAGANAVRALSERYSPAELLRLPSREILDALRRALADPKHVCDR